MESLRHGFEEPGDEQVIRLVVDTIPTLAWSAAPDGSADFFNQRWLWQFGPHSRFQNFRFRFLTIYTFSSKIPLANKKRK